MFQGFDATQHKAKLASGDPIPAGWVVGAVTKAEYKPTSNGTGHYFAAEFTVLTGEHKGRKWFVNYNLDNPNQQAREIAVGEFSALCHGIGVLKPKRETDVCNKPAHFLLGVKKDRKKANESQAEWDARPPRNFIKEIRPLAGDEAVPAIPTAAAPGQVQGAAASPAAAKAAPSWAKNRKAKGEDADAPAAAAE